MPLKAAVTKQFDATCRELRLACEQIPPEHWRTGEIDYLIPARQVLHAAGTAVWYFQNKQTDWSSNQLRPLMIKHFGHDVNWERTPPGELPDQPAMLHFLEASVKHCSDWLDGKSDTDLLAGQESFPWTGPNTLSRCIYVIRHTQAHIGEINSELRRRGLPRIQWQT